MSGAETLLDGLRPLGFTEFHATLTRQIRERWPPARACEACQQATGWPVAFIEHPAGEEPSDTGRISRTADSVGVGHDRTVWSPARSPIRASGAAGWRSRTISRTTSTRSTRSLETWAVCRRFAASQDGHGLPHGDRSGHGTFAVVASTIASRS